MPGVYVIGEYVNVEIMGMDFVGIVGVNIVRGGFLAANKWRRYHAKI